MARVLTDTVSDFESEEPLIQSGANGSAESAGIERLPNDFEGGLLRPEFKRDSVTPTKVIPARDFLKLPPEKPLLRPVFDKPKTSGVAEFFLAPPKQVAIEEGVRPAVKGKFIFVGEEKFYIRGVTYGPFRPDEQGCEYHDPETVERDFAQMAENGINTVRTYTVPPRWLLDVAQKHNLRVMVGLPWEEHIAFMEDPKLVKDIEDRVRAGVRSCAGHSALLSFTIGNEIPASIVRWYGRRRIERFLERLYRVVKEIDRDVLVTYVNFPTTEYLELPFVDFVSFNVYLETREKLEGYLARLQNLAGEKPLVMAEIGYDSMRNGEDKQAATLDWQIRSAFGSGCAGVFVFAWTDEWHRGGFDIDDWGFGLTDRDRNPKPSMAAITKAFSEIPFPPDLEWPSISVVVCTYNGKRTIRDALDGLKKVDYPNFEVIVVNDGSRDGTEIIAKEYGFRVISIPNGGLSNARNVGMRAAKGEIVAYLDDDAIPDPQWLTYLAVTFLTSDHVGVGGPNIPPPDDGPIADCVANSPGGPVHVLLTDQEAEHIPGCNMAFRKAALEAITGFDPTFRIAGDDVDLCWRLQERGWTLGFNPAAMVWHHRRNSVKTYWKQQLNYGKAEGYLEQKWPEKYNAAGHVPWAGRLYFKGFEQLLGCFRGRVYQGTWGSALFQSVYQPAPSLLWSLPLMPEWYVIIAALGIFSVLGIEWFPLLLAAPLFLAALALPVAHAVSCASRLTFPSDIPRSERLKRRALTALLHLMQPLARLTGRIKLGLHPWRKCGVASGIANPLPWPKMFTIWSEQWRSPIDWLETLEQGIKRLRTVVLRGGDYDRWDLELRGGLLGSVRVLLAVEEHGGGKQFIRVKSWPRCTPAGIFITLLFAGLGACAAVSQAWFACGVLNGIAIVFMMRVLIECSSAMSSIVEVFRQSKEK
ncbi:MAG: glycosyltransferase [Syntrophobacteraceae bacterium]